jgi:hypothetical protein
MFYGLTALGRGAGLAWLPISWNHATALRASASVRDCTRKMRFTNDPFRDRPDRGGNPPCRSMPPPLMIALFEIPA